jgi:carbonic anhydrase
MKNRLAASFVIGTAYLGLAISLGFAADNPSPAEKAKPIDAIAKPTIAKPSDALVPKAKEASKLETAPSSKQAISSGAQMPSPAAEVAPAAAQTPSGRPITDLKVMPASGSALKATSGSVPGAAPAAAGSANASSQAPAADPLEEKVRNLLQDRLGKDGEVVLRVSPDTPIAKQDRVSTNTAAKSRSEGVGPVESKTEPHKFGDGVTPIKRSAGITATGNDVHPWDWRGPRGPEAWGRIDPSYAACSSGKLQSPPTIPEAQITSSSGPGFPQLHWKPQSFRWTRQGPLWTANLDAGSSTVFRGQTYLLEAIQFRIPGEPFIGEKATAASIHLVHRLDERLLIVAIPIEVDDKASRSPAIASLLRRFPFEPSETLNWTGLHVNPTQMLPKAAQSAVLFSGSLSYPPCTESVLWLLVQPSIKLPTSQLTELAKLLGVGSRSVQPLNGRAVLSIPNSRP